MPSVQRSKQHRRESNPYSIGNGVGDVSHGQMHKGRQIWSMPIPPVDPREAVFWNDEIDMYIPRKHVLTKFKINVDLVDNACSKPFPADSISPPDLFPQPIFEGVKLEDKREEMRKESDKQQVLENTNQENGNSEDENVNRKEQKAIDDEESKLREYLEPLIKDRKAFDFTIGDPLTMKMHEEQLKKELDQLKLEVKDCIRDDESLKFKLDTIDKITKKYHQYSAEETEQNENFIFQIEDELKQKHKLVTKDVEFYRQFTTNAFDSEKVSITFEKYQELKSKQQYNQTSSYQQAYNQQQGHISQQQTIDGFDNNINLWQDNNDNGLNNFGEHENEFTGFF